MQFKIPQNVEIEDKIIAFVSFKQLFIMLGGGGIAYLIYIIAVDKFPITAWAIPVVVILLLTVLTAFFKIDNISFAKAILLFLEMIINPQKRLWETSSSFTTQLDILASLSDKEINKSTIIPAKQLDINDLDRITSILDKHG